MRLQSTIYPALGLLLPLVSVVSGQSVLDSIPQCYQDCISQSGDFTCNGLDIKCLCRLSNGNFLTNVITCIRGNCDNNLNTTSLVGPVAETCKAYGVPIAPAVVENAKSIGASLAATATTKITKATTMTSTIASAGTMYIVAIPIRLTTGPSGVRTVTATPRTILASSIRGGSAISISTVTSTATASSSISDSSSATSTVSTTSTTSASSSSGASDQQAGASQGGDGSPFGSTSSDACSIAWQSSRWLAIAIGIIASAMLF